MKKTSMIALLAMFLTASLTFATGSIQATAQENTQELDCWSNEADVTDPFKQPDMSIERDCSEGTVICCYNEEGTHYKNI